LGLVKIEICKNFGFGGVSTEREAAVAGDAAGVAG
jgi:hypothetical protein